MSQNEKGKNSDSSHVSLFPIPPWQLINRHQVTSGSSDQPLRPPTPIGSSVYRMFGNLYNADDAMLRSLESQGVRRVYPQVYNRKRELRKINFSILANYLDLLDIITRDPSSPKRTEWLDHLAVLFINMHHLINEYRQHQARDLLREILKYQVTVASQTVTKADQYMTRADELLRNAGSDLLLPGPSSGTGTVASLSTSCIDTVRTGLLDLGPPLAPLLQTVLDATMGGDSNVGRLSSTAASFESTESCKWEEGEEKGEEVVVDMSEHLDSSLWHFLTESQSEMTQIMDTD